MKVGCFPVGGPTPTPANFYFLYRPSSNKKVQKQLTVEDVQPTRIFVNVGYLFNSVFFTLSLMNLSCSFAVWGFRVLWKKDPFVSFYRASIASRGICCHRVSVCLSVCPSVTSRSSTRWLNVESHKQRHTIAQGLWFSGTKISVKFIFIFR